MSALLVMKTKNGFAVVEITDLQLSTLPAPLFANALVATDLDSYGSGLTQLVKNHFTPKPETPNVS